MGYSLNLDNWLIANKYIYKSTRQFGALYSLQGDYEVYVKCEVKQKILGVQIDKKSKTFYIGKLRSFKTKEVNEKVISKTVTSYATGSRVYYDDTLEEVLGGDRQTLGE